MTKITIVASFVGKSGQLFLPEVGRDNIDIVGIIIVYDAEG